MLTESEIEEIKRREEAATPGPWTSYIEGRDQWGGSSFIMTSGEDIYLEGASIADQDFVAGARQDVPKLLDEVRRLQGLLKAFGAE